MSKKDLISGCGYDILRRDGYVAPSIGNASTKAGFLAILPTTLFVLVLYNPEKGPQRP